MLKHHLHPLRRHAVAALLLPLWLAAGCSQGKTYTDYTSFIKEPRPLVSSSSYRMMPPDMVEITSKRVREINGYREQIRTDGKISPPLLGTVFVAGRTPEEVSLDLSVMAQHFYEDADVSVRVSSYASQKIFVFGEVGAPGPYPYTGANTVLSTMALAQPSRLADAKRVQVLRPDIDGEMVHRMTIDLEKMVRTGDVALNAVLEEGDIIYVPPTGFAAVGLALQQLLLPIQPAAAVVGGPPDIYQSAQQKPFGARDFNQ